jgi:DNA repair exonuclease SbcCD ATPase subunit
MVRGPNLVMPPNKKITYQKKAAERLKRLKTKITTLEKQSKKAEADIEVRHDQKLSQIRGQYAQTKEKLSDLRKSTQEAWLDARAKLDDAIDSLEEAIDVIAYRISGQSKE